MGAVKPRVSLVRATPDPDRAIAGAARLCYASDPTGLFDNDESPERFIGKLIDMGHLSPMEHAVFTFYVEGVSRAMTHQLVRHRMASYSQRSQRYVTHDDFDYIVPPQLDGKTVAAEGGSVDAVEYYEETMALIAERYARLNDALGRAGETSNEDARYVLPNACETKIVVSMNARELLHFFGERLCGRAQWEIRSVAEAMLRLVQEVCPSVFNGVGPKCVREGRCPEGRLSCGRFDEMKRRYGAHQ
ncbi:MAG TPA: FAD-dependent thymidylate synthase [Candidatus Hydrogenedentes bacterium]|nr:FAD-dependent thymidylate synthase [Candidatus Hydrogenedentota bacterium]HPG65441.1 FAD-dependent thymidylate synthase [Candidatus Hydrogenedentota bacterium]